MDVEQRDYFDGTSYAQGLIVADVIAGGPAAHAGLLPGDIITSFDGTAVSSPTTITDLLVAARPGATVSLGWLGASGVAESANVTLASGPAQ